MNADAVNISIDSSTKSQANQPQSLGGIQPLSARSTRQLPTSPLVAPVTSTSVSRSNLARLNQPVTISSTTRHLASIMPKVPLPTVTSSSTADKLATHQTVTPSKHQPPASPIIKDHNNSEFFSPRSTPTSYGFHQQSWGAGESLFQPEPTWGLNSPEPSVPDQRMVLQNRWSALTSLEPVGNLGNDSDCPENVQRK